MRRTALRAFLIVAALAGCRKTSAPEPIPADAAPAVQSTPPLMETILAAEDRRRATDIPAAALNHPDVAVRRLSARALARIADKASVPPLTVLLQDDDSQVVAWAAYGLGFACKGREDATVRALSARWASWAFRESGRDGGGSEEITPSQTIPRALAKCGGPLVEKMLAEALRHRDRFTEGAVLALGDLAVKKKELDADSLAELIRLASPSEQPPFDLAFYPLSRVSTKDARVTEAAVQALARKGDARIFAIKTMAKNAKVAIGDLEKVVLDAPGFTVAERVEAVRALSLAGEEGKKTLASLLTKLAPSNDPFRLTQLGGSEFHVLLQVITSLADPPPEARDVLSRIAVFQAPGEPPSLLLRRIEEMRCAAALTISDGAFDKAPLAGCAPAESYTFQKAKLLAIGQKSIVGARKQAWQEIAKSGPIRVREQAIEQADTHPELRQDLLPVLAEALRSKHAGLVAVAADAIHSHPERTLVLTKQEIAAGLDPAAKAPSASPLRVVESSIEKALASAIREPWASDLFETRTALMQAAASVGAPWASQHALALCHDPNATVREHAATALRSLGESNPQCEARGGALSPFSMPNLRPTKIVFTTDVGELSITLDPSLAPVTSERIATLARSSFFKGIVVHRVVPGFVAQFGDPGGDGYGGAGVPLRCETSPVPFLPLDVGMALAGRDTGSSQLFVTLSRTPHLDGAYAHVGRAEGDWSSLSEGDTIRDVRVRE